MENHQGEILDYWRVERSDSVIILPLHRKMWLLPPTMHRPGAGISTWDFPGGRALANLTLIESAMVILERELQIPKDRVLSCNILNPGGWWIDSSFSNQKLYGFVAEIDETYEISSEAISAIYPVKDTKNLLAQFTCLQCRSLLQQWLLDIGLKTIT